MSSVPRPSSREIATAINEYLRALRRLGHLRCVVFDIQCALGLSEQEVKTAFAEYKISGAKMMDHHTGLRTKAETFFSDAISLKV